MFLAFAPRLRSGFGPLLRSCGKGANISWSLAVLKKYHFAIPHGVLHEVVPVVEEHDLLSMPAYVD